MVPSSAIAGGEDEPNNSKPPAIYDTYVCREPAGDVSLLINNGPDRYTALLRTLQRSADHFAERDQNRTVERIQFEMVRLHMENGQWQRAMRTLVPLWQNLSWRQSGWWHLLAELDWALKECARRVQDTEMLVAVEWELMNRSLTARQESCTNFGSALEGLGERESRTRSVLRDENVLSCLSTSFAFSKSEGNVGESLESQLVLISNARSQSSPITISEIQISFEGGFKTVVIRHTDENVELVEHGQISLQKLDLQSPSNSITTQSSPISPSSDCISGIAGLQLSPGKSKVLSFQTMPREAGEVLVTNITLYIKEKDFDLELVLSGDRSLHQDQFWTSSSSKLYSRPLKRNQSSKVKVLPKPPKMQIGLLGILSAYFVDESVVLDINIANEEEEAAEGVLDVRLSGPPGTQPQISWEVAPDDNNPLGDASDGAFVDNGYLRLPPAPLGKVKAGGEMLRQMKIHGVRQPTEYALYIEARYQLQSDPETIITKTHHTDLVFIQPFEVSGTFTALIHPDPWPSLFDVTDIEEDQDEEFEGKGDGVKATGLIQRWAITSRITSQATDDLMIDSVKPIPHRIPGVVISQESSSLPSASSTTSQHAPTLITPLTQYERTHILDIQKISLDDRRPATLDLDVEIRFHRRQPRPASLSNPPRPLSTSTSTSKPLSSNTIPPTAQSTHIQIQTQLPLLSLPLPFSEPRILASLPSTETTKSANAEGNSPPPPSRAVELLYTLENPSPYTLPFSCTMDTSPTFAFSGPKSCAVQLLPLTRRTFVFRILPIPSSSSSSSATGPGPGLGPQGDDYAERGGEERAEGVWIYPVFRVVDTMFSKRLKVWPAAAAAVDEEVGDAMAKGGGGGGGKKATLRSDTHTHRRHRDSVGSTGGAGAGAAGSASGTGSGGGGGGGGIALWIPFPPPPPPPPSS